MPVRHCPTRKRSSGFDGLKRYLAEDRIDQVSPSASSSTWRPTRPAVAFPTMNSRFLKRDGVKLKADGYRMQDMIRYVVKSPIFLEK